MRESTKTERMHLGDAYEEWLKRQIAQPEKTKHSRRPVEDLYEAWVEKRVKKRLSKANRELA